MGRSGLPGSSVESHLDVSQHLQVAKHLPSSATCDEPSDLEELEKFAKTFKQRRIKLGFTQVRDEQQSLGDGLSMRWLGFDTDVVGEDLIPMHTQKGRGRGQHRCGDGGRDGYETGVLPGNTTWKAQGGTTVERPQPVCGSVSSCGRDRGLSGKWAKDLEALPMEKRPSMS